MAERSIELQRKAADGWVALREEATWCTNLNDMRMIASGLDGATWQRTVLRELKLLCLFHGRRIVLADSDLINDTAFQQFFLDDTYGLQHAFNSGRLVLALRDTASGLADLNAQQGSKRADPGMAERAIPFARKFDRFFDANGLVALKWELASSASGFASMIQKLLEVEEAPLVPAEREQLRNAVRIARAAEPDGRLLFGHIYDYLVRRQALPTGHPVLQAVRAARMLNTSVNLGFSPSVALTDVHPAYTFFATNGRAATSALPHEAALLKCPVPRRVMLDTDLDNISFRQIASLQHHGDATGYFTALASARMAIGKPEFQEHYVAFFEALAAYMSALSRDCRFELLDWQKSSLQASVDAISADENNKRLLLLTCIPLMAVTAFATLVCMNVAPSSALSIVASPAGAVMGAGAAFVAKKAEQKRSRLKRFIEGSSSVPLLKVP